LGPNTYKGGTEMIEAIIAVLLIYGAFLGNSILRDL
jgi:hypothetical protein